MTFPSSRIRLFTSFLGPFLESVIVRNYLLIRHLVHRPQPPGLSACSLYLCSRPLHGVVILPLSFSLLPSPWWFLLLSLALIYFLTLNMCSSHLGILHCHLDAHLPKPNTADRSTVVQKGPEFGVRSPGVQVLVWPFISFRAFFRKGKLFSLFEY